MVAGRITLSRSRAFNQWRFDDAISFAFQIDRAELFPMLKVANCVSERLRRSQNVMERQIEQAAADRGQAVGL